MSIYVQFIISLFAIIPLFISFQVEYIDALDFDNDSVQQNILPYINTIKNENYKKQKIDFNAIEDNAKIEYTSKTETKEEEEEEEEEEEDGDINNNNDKENNKKYVILVFDRGYKTTFTEAKPILDKYDFKATLFVACDRTQSPKGLSWDQLRQLQNEGHDIQSHGSDHIKLIDLDTYEEMESIVREGKLCLQQQGFNPTVFQAPYNKGRNDPKISEIISKYFDFAFAEHAKYMFLSCDGWQNFEYGKKNYENSTDCSPYSSDGTPKPTNRYAMKEWSHDREKDKIYESKYLGQDPHGEKVNGAMLEQFIKILERQTEFNKDGEINAIPIVAYHRLDTNKDFDTSPELFEQEMQYLYENGYNVITLSDLGYDENQERFYIKNN